MHAEQYTTSRHCFHQGHLTQSPLIKAQYAKLNAENCTTKTPYYNAQAVLGVLRWLHEEEAVDAPYLHSALSEFEAACCACGLEPPAPLQALALEVALQQGAQYPVRGTEQQYSRLPILMLLQPLLDEGILLNIFFCIVHEQHLCS